jgi:hypothetical protein
VKLEFLEKLTDNDGVWIGDHKLFGGDESVTLYDVLIEFVLWMLN